MGSGGDRASPGECQPQAGWVQVGARGCCLSYLVGGHGHDPIQVFHQLLESGSLGGDGVPAIPHHHVPGRAEGRRGLSRSSPTPPPTGAEQHPGTAAGTRAGTRGQQIRYSVDSGLIPCVEGNSPPALPGAGKDTGLFWEEDVRGAKLVPALGSSWDSLLPRNNEGRC